MADCHSQIIPSGRLAAFTMVCAVILVVPVVSAQQNGIDTGIAPESVLPIEPDTLEGRMEAALLMVKLARPELAKRYLGEMLSMDPTTQQLIGLRNQFGTAPFLSFTNVEGLNPEASQLLQKLQAAIQAERNDPAYVSQLLPKLAGTARERSQALTELRSLGPYAVPPMLQAIENGSIGRDVLIFNLARLGDEAVPPLVGALQSPSTKVRNAATEVLGVISGQPETLWLWHAAFAESQPSGVQESARKAIARIMYDDPRLVNRVTSYGAGRKLLQAALKFLSGNHEWAIRYEDMSEIPVWTWDASQGTVVEAKTSRRLAAIHFAERLAREAAELSPANEDAPVAALAAMMIRDIEQAGWDQPVPTGPGTAHDLAVSAGPTVCEQVLLLAIDHNLPGAALSAATAMGLNGSRTQLGNSLSTPAIIEALDFPHPRVQFAAAVSILQWEPQRSFSGSHRVIEILTRAINSGSKPDSVVVDPNVQRGTATANLFEDLGYDSSLATTGQDGFLMAASSGAVELAVLHPNTRRWELLQTIENLKADSRTRNLPVVIYGPSSLKEKYQLVEQRYQNVVYVNEGLSSLDISRQLRPALQQISPPALTQEQRDIQTKSAAYWLQWIATHACGEAFDLLPHEEAIVKATANNLVADDAIVALGAIGTPSAQRRFQEFVTSPSLDLELRRRSALQLSFHMQRFGVLLSPAEIDAVVQLYRANDTPELATALASVVGSLKPNATSSGKLILSAPRNNRPVMKSAPAPGPAL